MTKDPSLARLNQPNGSRSTLSQIGKRVPLVVSQTYLRQNNHLVLDGQQNPLEYQAGMMLNMGLMCLRVANQMIDNTKKQTLMFSIHMLTQTCCFRFFFAIGVNRSTGFLATLTVVLGYFYHRAYVVPDAFGIVLLRINGLNLETTNRNNA